MSAFETPEQTAKIRTSLEACLRNKRTPAADPLRDALYRELGVEVVGSLLAALRGEIGLTVEHRDGGTSIHLGNVPQSTNP